MLPKSLAFVLFFNYYYYYFGGWGAVGIFLISGVGRPQQIFILIAVKPSLPVARQGQSPRGRNPGWVNEPKFPHRPRCLQEKKPQTRGATPHPAPPFRCAPLGGANPTNEGPLPDGAPARPALLFGGGLNRVL